MKRRKTEKERRHSPRLTIDLPLDYTLSNITSLHGGVAVNASEMGLLFRSVKDIALSTRIRVAILFPKNFELADLKLLAEIVWKDLHQEGDWQGYRYGAKIIKMRAEDRFRLKQLLSGQFDLKDPRSSHG